MKGFQRLCLHLDLLLLFFFAKKNKNIFPPPRPPPLLKKEGKLQKYFKYLLFFLRGKKMQCGFILAMQIFMWAKEKQDQREKVGLVVTQALVPEMGIYSWLCRSLSCNLEPVTSTSVPAAAHLLQLMRTPFFVFVLAAWWQPQGKKELFNSTGTSKHFGDVVIVENYGNLS